MLELVIGYTMSQVPYITYDALETYAENIIWDFAPERLNSPGVIDADRFLEFYLRLNVDYRRIGHSRQILGMTAFNNGTVEIMDEETGKIEYLPVTAGTVIIDSSLTAKRNKARRRFTMIHEGCHWLLHQKAFAEDNPFGAAGIYANQFLAAKEGLVDYSRSMDERTDIQMMERQADFLTSAIHMPRPALRKSFRTFFGFYGEKPHSSRDKPYGRLLRNTAAGVRRKSL